LSILVNYISIKNILSCLIWAISLFFTISFYAQEVDNVPDIISSRIENASKNHVPEEVYIQVSKNIYETSEDLWFKGYALNAQHHTPSVKAKTLYVSLLQLPDRKVVWEEKYAVINGFTDGHIYIQDTLQPGEYALVAQTVLSANSDDKVIKSVRKIEIIQNIVALEGRNHSPKPIIEKTDSINFQFMPEGGHLVAGIKNKVAFKVVDRIGNPVEVKGTLYEGGKPMFTIAGFHAGMGAFYIVPTPDAVYSVKLEGYPQTYILPKTEASGHVLQLLYNKSDTLTLKVAQGAGIPSQKMYIRLQVRGLVYNTAGFVLNNEKHIKILTKEIPPGIAEVTLFNSEFQPVDERLVFINENRKLHITSAIDRANYGSKEKVKLKIRVADENGNPIVAHLGVSVTDDIYLDHSDSETIASYYQLSTQIRGKISGPGYYFNPKNANREQALDLLLLTQGWRAYQWGEQNLAQLINRQHTLSDTLTGTIYAKKQKAGDKLAQQIVMAHSGDRKSVKTLLQVDGRGKYTILPEDLQYEKRGFVYFKLLYSNNDMGIRSIADPNADRFKQQVAQNELLYPLQGTYKKAPVPQERFKVAKNVNQLKEVVLTAKVKNKRLYRDKYMGTLDSLAVEDYVCFLNVLNCPNHTAGGRRPKEGEIYLDGATGRQLRPYHRHHYTEEELLAKFNMVRVKSYYPHKEFYNPVYDAETIDNTTDARNTLFWKPDVITDATGTAEVEFYTSDVSSKFRVMIEGVSGDGLLGSEAMEFKVEKKGVE